MVLAGHAGGAGAAAAGAEREQVKVVLAGAIAGTIAAALRAHLQNNMLRRMALMWLRLHSPCTTCSAFWAAP